MTSLRSLSSAPVLRLLCFLAALLSGCAKRETIVERSNREGIFHYSIGAEPSDLDPQTVTGTGDAKIIQALFDPLVSYETGTLAPVPGLAERWDISPDGPRPPWCSAPRSSSSPSGAWPSARVR